MRGHPEMRVYEVTVERETAAYEPARVCKSSRDWGGVRGCRAAFMRRRLVLALAQDGEREGEQEDQNRDHDHECHTFAHPVSSPKVRGVILYHNPRVRGYEDEQLPGRIMYNVATCSSLVP